MAMAELALEIMYIIEVLRALGHLFEFDGSDLETSDPETPGWAYHMRPSCTEH